MKELLVRYKKGTLVALTLVLGSASFVFAKSWIGRVEHHIETAVDSDKYVILREEISGLKNEITSMRVLIWNIYQAELKRHEPRSSN